MTKTERITEQIMHDMHSHLLLADVKRFVQRITEIQNDPDLDGPERMAIMSGAARGFGNVFATRLEALEKSEVAK